MTSISSARAGAAAAVTRGGAGGGAGSASATLTAIATDVSATVAGELGLAALDPDGRRDGGSAQDFYGIEEAAERLATELQATPGEAGEIARLLHLFAAEVAARIGAIPDARSVEEIGRLVARCSEDVRDARGAILMIDRAVRELAA